MGHAPAGPRLNVWLGHVRWLLSRSANVSVFGLLAGAVLGALVTVAVVSVELSKAPVQIVESGLAEQASVQNGVLALRYRFLRRQECNSVTAFWLWRWDVDSAGQPVRYWVALATNPVAVSDPSPLLQDMVLALPLPRIVGPGQWFLRTKFLDYCRLASPLFGPTTRVAQDVPITIEGAAR